MIDKIFYVLLLAVFASAEIPSYIHVCGRRNPKLDDCIRESIDNMKDKFLVGIPELDIPSINPLIVRNVKLAELPNFQASADNVKMYGLGQYTIDDLHLDLDKKQIDFTVSFNSMKILADYDVNAKIIVPVVGHGPIEMTTENVKAKITMLYKIIKRNNKNYAYFYSMKTKLEIQDFTADFKDQSGADSTLTTAINAALIDSKKEILDSTVPNLEKKISETILEISNQVCKHFHYEELFPDRE
ncbi:hypothetical protein KPH14_005263 [Odynerus spinipes]|uniref:Protein takeout-like n=1 Tax=Odynerus spinipes TaxID=1348599 RepID=A0AAD9RC23_9HYME|nr:hypothetical protein KPH14_005263 [Odynerus spinipes]